MTKVKGTCAYRGDFRSCFVVYKVMWKIYLSTSCQWNVQEGSEIEVPPYFDHCLPGGIRNVVQGVRPLSSPDTVVWRQWIISGEWGTLEGAAGMGGFLPYSCPGGVIPLEVWEVIHHSGAIYPSFRVIDMGVNVPHT